MAGKVLEKATIGGERLRDSEFLSKADVTGEDLVCRILRVKKNLELPVSGTSATELKPALKVELLDGTVKKMVLVPTNEDILVKLHGSNADHWPGKFIALYVDPEVKLHGKKVGGLRIRTTAPKPSGGPPQ